MTTLDDTIRGLCAALDAGDDRVLPILADALEDAGDGRAAGLRGDLPRPVLSTGHGRAYWVWWRRDAPCRPNQGVIRVATFFHLRGMVRWNFGAGWAYYDTRSAAYLALAAALVEDTQ